jgi:hypothetical protein
LVIEQRKNEFDRIAKFRFSPSIFIPCEGDIILAMNFHSVKNKKEELCNLIDSSNPRMIIGTETWLRKDISNSEIFSDSYTVYRKDSVVIVLLHKALFYSNFEIL